MITLDPKTTALVLIDLQNGILAYPLAPLSGQDLLAQGKKLAETFRKAGASVVLVNVGWEKTAGKDMPPSDVDMPLAHPQGGFPAGWSDLAAGLQQDGDILITKRQWGAFHGTELDLQLRRRGITTIVLGGVATHMGVESTARGAWEHGYKLVILKDATSSLVGEAHDASMKFVFPRISRLADSGDLKFG